MEENLSLAAIAEEQAQLGVTLEGLQAIADRQSIRLSAAPGLLEKLRSGTFELVVLGAFKRGKSTFINALVGEEVLPSAVVPVTSVVTTLRYGEPPGAQVRFEDGHVEAIDLGALVEFVAESRNPENRKHVAEVTIVHPAAILRHRARLIDTPGIGSIYGHQTRVAHEVLPRADAAVFLLSADPPISDEELAFVREVRPFAPKLFFVLNKIDRLSPAEQREAADFTATVLAREIGQGVELYPLSAREGLLAKVTHDEARFAASGLGLLQSRLETFLARERGAVQLEANRQAVARVGQDLAWAIALERKALSLPLSELEQKIARFEDAKRQLERQRRETGVLLDAETRELTQQTLPRALDAFREQALPLLLRSFEARARTLTAASAHALAQALESEVKRMVEGAWEGWRPDAEASLARDLDAVMHAHAMRTEVLVRQVRAVARELFDLPAAPIDVPLEPAGTPQFVFHFETGVEGLVGMTKTFWRIMLPLALVRRPIAREAVERLETLFVRQSNWLRQDMAARIGHALQDFGRLANARLDEAIAATESAIIRARQLRQAGVQASEARLQLLEDDAHRLAKMLPPTP